MLNRIRCHFFGHRPRRHVVKKSHFSAWTVCGRCDQLMSRGYYGWQRANEMEERRFERELAKRAAEYSEQGEAGLDIGRVPLPWIADQNPDEAMLREEDWLQPTRSRTTANPRSE